MLTGLDAARELYIRRVINEDFLATSKFGCPDLAPGLEPAEKEATCRSLDALATCMSELSSVNHWLAARDARAGRAPAPP